MIRLDRWLIVSNTYNLIELIRNFKGKGFGGNYVDETDCVFIAFIDQSIVHVWKQSENESEIEKPFDIKITFLQGRVSTLIGWSDPALSSAAKTGDAGFNPIVILRSILRERHGTAPRFRSALFQLFIRCGARARLACARTRRAREETDESALVRTSRNSNALRAPYGRSAVFQRTCSTCFRTLDNSPLTVERDTSFPPCHEFPRN